MTGAAPKTVLIFAPNRRLLVWIFSPLAPPELLAEIRSGAWRLPPWIGERLLIPQGLKLFALFIRGLILVIPDRPLLEVAPARPQPQPLGDEDRRLLALIMRGMTTRQAGARLGRSPRWVRYQLARLRLLCGELVLPERFYRRRLY